MGLILCRKLIDFSWTKKNTLITVILTVLKEVKYSRRDKMNVIFCRPEITMEDVGDAICFFNECHTILDKYIYNLRTIGSYELIRQIMLENADKDDIFIFFTSENGVYDKQIMMSKAGYGQWLWKQNQSAGDRLNQFLTDRVLMWLAGKRIGIR